MKRRRYRWTSVAALARQNDGHWVLHPDLIAITTDTLHHMRRRVRALAPTDSHVYEYARGAEAKDDLGVTRFDCFIRYVPKGTAP